jgi:hypothetical protein
MVGSAHPTLLGLQIRSQVQLGNEKAFCGGGLANTEIMQIILISLLDLKVS